MPAEASPSPDGAVCYLALGSNLGDRAGHLASAWQLLGDHPAVHLLRRAGLYETAPVGGPAGQGPYLNTVLSASWDLTPDELLSLCLRTETCLGRQRLEPNGPRTIDIDLLLFGEHACDTPGLILPHPRLHLRRFVLEPLAEIAPGVVHPLLDRRIDDLLSALEPAEATGELCSRVAGPDWDCTRKTGPCPA